MLYRLDLLRLVVVSYTGVLHFTIKDFRLVYQYIFESSDAFLLNGTDGMSLTGTGYYYFKLDHLVKKDLKL